MRKAIWSLRLWVGIETVTETAAAAAAETATEIESEIEIDIESSSGVRGEQLMRDPCG